MTDQKSSATEAAAYKLVGDLSPRPAELNDEVLLGDVFDEQQDGRAR